MRVAVSQSNYIPWKGYFDLIHDVDLFVFYDDVQYTTSDWRNRNRIKAPDGARWLTIPVGHNRDWRICDVPLPAGAWAAAHRQRLRQCYREAPFYREYEPLLSSHYERRPATLSELNQSLTVEVARTCLGIETAFRDSREFPVSGRKQERLIALLRAAGATSYVTGPAARAYIEASAFEQAGIELVWKDYGGYPEYPQQFPPFVHEVSIVDLLFNVGPAASDYIWGWRGREH